MDYLHLKIIQSLLSPLEIKMSILIIRITSMKKRIYIFNLFSTRDLNFLAASKDSRTRAASQSPRACG